MNALHSITAKATARSPAGVAIRGTTLRPSANDWDAGRMSTCRWPASASASFTQPPQDKMAKRRYALEFGKPARLEISWDGALYRVRGNITIRCDGAVLARFPAPSALRNSQAFSLADGSSLRVQLVSERFEIYHNGRSIQAV